MDDLVLKPCPFCGGTQIGGPYPDAFDEMYYVSCISSPGRSCASVEGPSKAVACERWNTRAADRIEALSDRREEIAREAALHGLGRIDGLGNREPPNEKWTQGEWERRILECVPGAVELQCYALTDAILALISPTTESPNE